MVMPQAAGSVRDRGPPCGRVAHAHPLRKREHPRIAAGGARSRHDFRGKGLLMFTVALSAVPAHYPHVSVWAEGTAPPPDLLSTIAIIVVIMLLGFALKGV